MEILEKAEIKDRIREAMELRELTQSELSEKAKIDKGQLSSYLSGNWYNRICDYIFVLQTFFS